jgi:putative membrane protein
VRPSDLIGPADRRRLEGAVLAAERATAGEIVLVVVRACDPYAHAGWLLGVVFALLAFLGVAVVAPGASHRVLLGAEMAGLLIGHALARLDPIRRHLLSEAVVESHVAARARLAFAENGLTRTAGRTGILIFVALLERRVVVLADEGVHRALGPEESWEEVVARAVAGLRAGRPVEGLLAAVERCGEILAAHLPAPPRNADELPRAVVLEDGAC